MNRDVILSDIVNPLVALLSQRGVGEFHVSSIPLEIDGTSFKGGHEHIQGFYAFSTGGQAIRVEIVEDYVHSIGIWKTPGDLIRPDLRVEVTAHNEEEIVDIIAAALGQGFTESVEKLFEGFQDDYAEFMKSVGKSAQGKKVAQIYRAYVEWAASNGYRTMSYARFGGFVKDQQLSGGGDTRVISKANNREQIIVEPAQMSEFEKDIMENEVLYIANMLDNTLRRMSADDPGIVSMFLCGGAGLGKSFTVKKILKEEGAWRDPPRAEDPSVHGKVVYKSGSIAGFTGLLQILWDYRKDYIVVLDDNDSILAIPKAANILKACLNSNPEDRWVSYTKIRK